MSDVIRLLPDSVANQIAAGEVIQRPASVVKELVENAIDAGASHIDVLVTDAGKTCIQVIDNGKGMSETDARLAFERHATSKIREASDLFALHTMGFRGEALASIAAVAQVELRTCQKDAQLGTLITLAGSKVESQETVACAQGSNFCVRNLFFNVPARRKFLKSNQTELSNILAEFERIALVNPDVSFTLHHNDTEMLNLPAIQLRQRIMGVFGKKLNQDLLSLEIETTMVKIHGFIGKPETARKKGARQFFFVNGRYMRHPYFHKAVADAYENLIPAGEQVSYFIYMEVDPANIDVNIHPTKTEIKFDNEQAIWQILSAAVKETLGRFNAVPSIDFDTEGMPEIPAFEASPYEGVRPPSTSLDPSYNPFNVSSATPPSSYSPSSRGRHTATEWEPLFQGLDKKAAVTPDWDTPAQSFPAEEWEQPEETPAAPSLYGAESGENVMEKSAQHYQYKGCYILTSVKSGLMIIDQHRAHVRILYDRYMEQISMRKHASQRMLFPDMVHFSPAEIPVLESIMDDLQSLGFDLSNLGGGSYSINGVPAGIEGLNPEKLVGDMVQTAIEKGCKVKEEVQSMLALSLAKAAAIVPGQVLTNEEMNNLVDELFALATPNYTPDGKTVLSLLKEDDLEKMFK
ncbi:DNA mismatch repair endonuclease MutL [Phocaeicola faecicola]|jgi:DNA mismatch repair protein MutL|uniref:DNA mismatch repair endonuclease MutL n=1 Tax=Phocaeicola faecicola TaxID=2739389 RepID=UPI0015B42978|nr:DNA mismatch repair endonuclease MutL [Phocaeicola faecicola]MCI5743030.1 DNA mismatch repair endonuclease MutL [Bacteroides sp.]MDD6908170.1 DNA mismatch repair endonuclease MutL [Bacteroidaceae bacterium]MDY4871227.1 DNA mismatch repair endonuclease MutL [Phocaeicola faecicola]